MLLDHTVLQLSNSLSQEVDWRLTYITGIWIAMEDEFIDSAGDWSSHIPEKVRQALLVNVLKVCPALGRDDALSSSICRSSILSISVDDMAKSKRFALWAIHFANIGLLFKVMYIFTAGQVNSYHIHCHIIQNLCRELDVEIAVCPLGKGLQILAVHFCELQKHQCLLLLASYMTYGCSIICNMTVARVYFICNPPSRWRWVHSILMEYCRKKLIDGVSASLLKCLGKVSCPISMGVNLTAVLPVIVCHFHECLLGSVSQRILLPKVCHYFGTSCGKMVDRPRSVMDKILWHSFRTNEGSGVRFITRSASRWNQMGK